MHQNPAPSIGLTFYVVLVAYCCIFTVYILVAIAQKLLQHFLTEQGGLWGII